MQIPLFPDNEIEQLKILYTYAGRYTRIMKEKQEEANRQRAAQNLTYAQLIALGLGKDPTDMAYEDMLHGLFFGTSVYKLGTLECGELLESVENYLLANEEKYNL